MTPDTARLRNLAALLTIISGSGQCAALWLLPTSKTLLLTAFLGSTYLLLALGLFGTSRLPLVLAFALLPLRAWSGLYPLEISAWETLRSVADLLIAVLCLRVLWVSLDHRYAKHPANHREARTIDPPRKQSDA